MKKKLIVFMTVLCMIVTTSGSAVYAKEDTGSPEPQTEITDTANDDKDSTIPGEEQDPTEPSDPTQPEVKNGWITDENGNKRYYQNDEMQTGWVSVDDKEYYLGEDGILRTATKVGNCYVNKAGEKVYKTWVKLSGKYYYYGAKGNLCKNMKVGNYCVNKYGARVYKQWVKRSGKYYYYGAKGTLCKNMKVGNYYVNKYGTRVCNKWIELAGKYYYYGENGKLCKDTIIGNYYVNKNGVRVTNKAAVEAVKIVNKVSKDEKNNTKAKKLRACFNVIKGYGYLRSYENPLTLKDTWPSDYAYYMFKNKRGNCYKYASCFAYCAEVLGYDARVCAGKIKTPSMAGAAPHGWAEIKYSDGSVYTFDPNMQRNTPSKKYYKRSKAENGNIYRLSKRIDIIL